MKNRRVLTRSLALSIIYMSACSSQSPTHATDDVAAGDGGSRVDAGAAKADGGGRNPSGGSDGGGASSEAGGPQTVLDAGPSTSGTYDIVTTLPSLPKLENTVAVTTSDAVKITFLPFEGARDYRVYELPKDGDVVVSGDQVHVRNATYRCAGQREVPMINSDAVPEPGGIGARTLVDGIDVDGYKRTLAQAVLGYVYYAPGDGLVPVYVLGDPAPNSDNWAFQARFSSTRTKRYTSSSDVRSQLLAAGWRDDGIAFYVPSAASDSTQSIYTSLNSDGHTRYYFGDGDEKKVRMGAELAFSVLKAQAGSAQPLYRVFTQKYQASSHDELVIGKTMFDQVRFQGVDKPVTQLMWSGLSGPTTLVVEALDGVCPYAGRLAAESIAADTQDAATDNGKVTYPAAITLDQARAASPTGELYINGQSASTTAPKAVARAFLQVAPQANESFDFFAGFAPGTTLPAFNEVNCGTPSGNCYQQWRYVSTDFDLNWHTVATGQHAIGNELGQLWIRYADHASDTNGKFRLTPIQKGTVTSDSYLHATMEVTSITTARRYPQIIISDRSAPVQDFLDQGNSVIIQTFRNWPTYLELQICDHRTWDVNNQCPFFQFYERNDSSQKLVSLAPVDEAGELTGADMLTRFDVFLSSKRAYLMMDRKPFGCVDLPASGIPQGAVTVTFGDVLYHSAADAPLGYHKQFLQYDTERRFDNLGFSSKVPEPQWDHDRVPCVAASTIGVHP